MAARLETVVASSGRRWRLLCGVSRHGCISWCRCLKMCRNHPDACEIMDEQPQVLSYVSVMIMDHTDCNQLLHWYTVESPVCEVSVYVINCYRSRGLSPKRWPARGWLHDDQDLHNNTEYCWFVHDACGGTDDLVPAQTETQKTGISQC